MGVLVSKRCLAVLFSVVLLLSAVWSCAALWFDGPATRWLAGALAAGFGLGCIAVLVAVRPYRRALLLVLAGFLIVLTWWLHIPPRNDRDWLPDVARLATATLEGSRLTVQNLRNFDYRTEIDYTQQWETRTYDLDTLWGLDIFLCFWGPTLVAHTIASWDFGDGSHLAISIETRKGEGESYSAVRGFFRQYEVYYVVADERDVVRLRTNCRGETVYLYRMKTTPAEARALLVDYFKEINALARKPRWYNALTHNCTTAIRYHAKRVHEARPWDWRLLANGRADELSYERGTIDTSLPFPELRRRSDITEKAKAADQDPAFSSLIREGLPGITSKAEGTDGLG